MEKKLNVPKRGAAKRLAEKLKKLGQKSPPKGMVERLIKIGNPQGEVAAPVEKLKDLEL